MTLDKQTLLPYSVGMKFPPSEGATMKVWKLEYSVRGASRISEKFYGSFEEVEKAKNRWDSSNSTGEYWSVISLASIEEAAAFEDKKRGAISQEEFSVLVAHGSRPVPFLGTEEERIANMLTHRFFSSDEGFFRCMDCDCNSWGITKDYPCGAEIPREEF